MTEPSAGVPDVRFHLPPGPAVPPKSWQRRYKWPIRIATAVVVLATVVGGLVALVAGYQARSTITAIGGVTVDCGTRAAAGTVPVAFGDRVEIFDAAENRSAPLAATRLDRLKALGGETCIAQFEVDDLETVDAYVVRIGDDYRRIVTPSALQAGYLFE
ncbi:hypothetical protein [Gordonia humi]|uniref:Uncharacterized protein n=1 Tax=Gordonia humi TaxID=686429 RepID=A0A840F2W4_9ACTN|nr:hypothetical protein [Gordonia humi]MBB4136813.1 hypothetical protein [Gordonia humi]